LKINLQSIDREHFNVHEKILNGEVVYLVIPDIKGVEWTQENKIFRSSVWDYDGNLISAGFPKFTNWGESPAQFPVPTDLKGATLVEKIDGSLLIVSKWKGNYILRTRGTIDATQLDNGHELEIFLQRFNQSMKWDTPDTWNVSLLFEWVSPTQQIVIQHGQPDWYMVGIVNHSNYSLDSQESLDMWGKNYGFKRPAIYKFTTISDLLDNVEKWVGKEGVCVYSKDGQVIHKVKSDWYLVRHHMRSEMSTIDKVLDYWFAEGRPGYEECYAKLATFDFEVAERFRGFISRICDADKEVKKLIEGMKRFIQERLIPLPSRKEQADVVFSSYGKTERTNCVFSLLDGKELNDKQHLKLMWQFLKK
jgi:hypothetical protein